ncbi:MAG: hypothetical protein HY962_05180 [Ignavibacteriae bacterium]|nr:hypothetical protein [Ignavibacteriota bacterium]
MILSASRSTLCAFVLAAALSMSANAQQPLRVDNSAYKYRVVETGGTALLRVDGIQPSIHDMIRYPHRIVELPCPDGVCAELEMADLRLSAPMRATPHVYYEQRLGVDSIITAEARPLPDGPAIRPVVISQTDGVRDGAPYVRLVVPLVSYDPSTNELRWIESFSLRPRQGSRLAAAQPLPAAAAPYNGQPFVRRSRHLDTSGAWMNYADKSLRFYVKNDGLVKLPKTWFAASGFSLTGVNPANLRLMRKGIEVPMLAVGMDDGSFDDADYFVFLGERNYEDPNYRRVPTYEERDEPYPEYLNKYTDSVAYWIVPGITAGARISTAAAAGTAGSDTLDWYYALNRYELEDEFHCLHTSQTRIQTSDWTSEDTWHIGGAGYVRYGQVRTYRTTLTNPKPGIDARFWGKFFSWYSEAPARPHYRILARLNGGPWLDSVEFNINEQSLLRTTIPTANILAGENQIEVFNRDVYPGYDGPQIQIVSDWFDIEYPRYLTATSNILLFGLENALGAGIRRIKVSNVTAADPLLLKRTSAGITRISALDLATSDKTLSFVDTVTDGATYALASIAGMATPFPGRTRNVPQLRVPAPQAKYIILTADELQTAAEEYAAFIRSQYNTTTRIVTVEDIYDNYSFGTFNPEALKLFLLDARNTWTQEEPENVLLAGDANWNLKNKASAWSRNYVPTYGAPASDTWFVCFDTLGIEQEISIGRLPVASAADLRRYLEKHRAYVAMVPDIWNKTTLHFSGGDANKGLESILRLREVNSAVIRDIVEPAPMAGQSFHFYKTVSPLSNFGPYTVEQIKKRISDGGIMISYIGHSGTDVWDNAIQETQQLDNARARASLVTDFGCSTGKFAEPDIVSFSEKFVTSKDGQAIAYVGNSSLGFEATSLVLPSEFYTELILSDSLSIGEAHRRAKGNLIRKFGLSTINMIAIRSNALIGDPIMRIAFPHKTNLVARPDWMHPVEELFTDVADSLHFDVAYWNEGRYSADTLTLVIEDLQQNTVLHRVETRRASPLLSDTVRVAFPVNGIAGTRRIRVTLDTEGRIDESSETDNTAIAEYFVYSTQIKAVNEPLGTSIGNLRRIAVLNPISDPGAVSNVKYEFSTSPGFEAPTVVQGPYGKTQSVLDAVPSTGADGKYYWRASLPTSSTLYAGPFAYWKGSGNALFVQRDSAEFARAEIRSALYDAAKGMTVLPPYRKIAVSSAGIQDGGYATVEIDDFNVLLTTYFQGYAVVVFDSLTLQLKRQRNFETLNNWVASNAFKAYVDSIQPGELAAITSAYDPRSNLAVFQSALNALGGSGIDSVAALGSYCMIGWRGAARGSVPEARGLPGKGKSYTSSIFYLRPDTAVVTSPPIGPAARWVSARLVRSGKDTTVIAVTVRGIDTAGVETEVLAAANPDSLDLSSLDAKRYPQLRLRAVMAPRFGAGQPALRAWAVDYRMAPELAVNYQSIAVVNDTVGQGTAVELHADVLNAGETDAGPFTLQVDIVGEDNIRRQIETVPVPGLAHGAWYEGRVQIPTAGLAHGYQALVVVDKDGTVQEQFEDNNTISARFVVRSDTTRPMLDVLLDGYPPLDGEIVSPTPRIVLTLVDRSPLPVTSCNKFTVRLDEQPFHCDSMTFTPGTATNDASVALMPHLSPGDHIFHFNAEDASGNKVAETDRELLVRVVTEASIRDVYNFPNPFAGATTFTFTLTGTGAPDEVQVKIYTVAGRLIRTMKSSDGSARFIGPSNTPRVGLNAVAWDGTDEDGDVLANGVYFYKVIAKSGAASQEFIGRLAVLR